ncbi:hypothetical protein [Flavobacterium silvaticum]|uniref:Uncharacterized protein n=1 Tax=Flavobacterium silvaticum TaxID=1852020 RepID=A0A972FU81_9FLAO|nr:hypothetical protein [Flavobacterium silvaticum]NMH28598.1 hypothetical protein [Flavobacterium silvaticum]
MGKIFSFFSYVFHPVFAPVYGVLLFLYIDVNRFGTDQKLLILAQTAIVTLAIPLIFFFLLRLLGKADSLMLPEVSQRRLPLTFQILMFYILIERSFTITAIPELHYFFMAGMISTCLALCCSLFNFRISLHMLGISGLLVFGFGLALHNESNMAFLIAGLSIINGLTATSRLILEAHDFKELIAGFLIGLVPQVLLLPMWI